MAAQAVMKRVGFSKLNSTATAQLNNFCRAALRNSFTLSPLPHATSLTAMRRHGVLGPLGHGSQALPYRTASCRTGADARAHAERGVPGTRSCGLLARCASGYDGDLYRALPFGGHWCPGLCPPYACLRDAGPVAPVSRPLLRPPIVASQGSLSCMVCSAPLSASTMPFVGMR